jgi:Hint domain
VTAASVTQLNLSNGGTAMITGATSGTALTFAYTPASNASNVTVTGLASGTLTDGAGNSVTNFGDTICFYPGTSIATPTGERPVETLAIGDLVLTREGRTMPVRWMGRQTVSTVFADKLRVLPIRITAGALGPNMPVRDLLVSPDHALLVDGILVQAGALVNGSTIRREHAVPERFTYWHVELADHSLILAEGVPAETFVDNVDRLAFDNWTEHEALYGDLPAIPELSLPRAKAARQVPMAVRARLAERANLVVGRAAA